MSIEVLVSGPLVLQKNVLPQLWHSSFCLSTFVVMHNFRHLDFYRLRLSPVSL